jgi:hypothetical protein
MVPNNFEDKPRKKMREKITWRERVLNSINLEERKGWRIRHRKGELEIERQMRRY